MSHSSSHSTALFREDAPATDGGAPQEGIAPVLEGGFCIGCGSCASLTDSPVAMRRGEFGLYEPRVISGDQAAFTDPALAAICPFASPLSEDWLGREVHAADMAHDERVGFYRSLRAITVAEGDYRARGSSSGFVTWLLVALMEAGEIDGVIHLGEGLPSAEREDEDDVAEIFAYRLSHSAEEVRARAKSRYYAAEFSQALGLLRERPGRYAFVGVPCYVKALRLLARTDPDIERSLAFTVAIFCGHMKSQAFAAMLGMQLGIEPDKLRDIDFRAKDAGQPADRYSVEVEGEGKNRGEAEQAQAVVRRRAPMRDLYGTDWGLGFFKPKACDYCDDIAGELADVACGDAWLPRFAADGRGTNLVVVRHAMVERLIEEGLARRALTSESLSLDEVYQSQAGNYRHRREGLAYRLWLAEQAGDWTPPKRTKAAAEHLPPQRRRIYQLRSALAARSHTAFRKAVAARSLRLFKQEMRPLVSAYYRANRVYPRHLAREAARQTRRLWTRLRG